MTLGSSHPVESSHHYKESLCKVVRKEVEEAFGHSIVTSRDCIKLSEEIYIKTSVRVNSNTLRRFFGLVKAQYPPSLSTLTILANYCGYHSLEEMSAVKKKMTSEQNTIEEKNILHYLVTLFSAMPLSGLYDEAISTFIKHTIKFLAHNPDLINKFQRSISKTKNGQFFYFEQFINMDMLNSYYGEGIRYYLSEKKSEEGQVFGYSLLCLKAWLSADHSSLKKHYDHLRKQHSSKLADPYLYKYYVAASILYTDAFKLDAHQLLTDAYKMHLEWKRSTKQKGLFISFEYTLATTLVLTNHYQDALYYINEAILTYTSSDNPMEQYAYRRLLLFKAVAFAQSGINDEAEKLFNQLQPSQFFFLSKKMDTILYLSLGCCLKRTNKKLVKQLEDLIDETGFLKLKGVLVSRPEHAPKQNYCEQK